MKWVTIKNALINTNNVDEFKWENRTLYIWFVADEEPAKWADPDRELYHKLCRQQGIRPYEED